MNWAEHPHADALLVRDGQVILAPRTRGEAIIAARRESLRGPVELHTRERNRPVQFVGGSEQRKKH